MTLQLVNDFVPVKNETKEEKKVIELYGETLEVEIEEFLIDKLKRSVNTHRAYQGDLMKLAHEMFNKPHYKYLRREDIEAINVDTAIKYFNDCFQEVDMNGQRVYSNQTISRRISSYKGLIKYLAGREKIKYNVDGLYLFLKSLPDTSEIIDVFSNEDADKVIEHLSNQNMGDILRLIAKTSVDTALRLNELLTLKWNQFTVLPLDNVVFINSRGETKGKGNKDWEKQISVEFYEELLSLKSEENDYVFNISRSKVSASVEKALIDLGLDKRTTGKNYSFHSFRKNSVDHRYVITGDIKAAQEHAGHKSPVTTGRYIKRRNYGAVGRFSLKNKINNNAYKEVSHEILLKAIENMDNNIKFLLNKELSSCVEGDNINTAVI